MNNKIIRGWKIIGEVGRGSLGVVYKAIKSDGSVCAIKHVSLPRSNDEIKLLINNGVINNYFEANKYFAGIIRREIETIRQFAGNQYIVNFCDIYQENRIDDNGIDFYIRMEYAEDITSYFKNRKVTVDDVIKIGIDICSALELCASINITHNDIKPNNIFKGKDGNYKLGDFSSITNIGGKELVKFGTFNYVSPEVYRKEKTSLSTDLYSLGLVMYKLLNGYLPFQNKDTDEKNAFNIRMSGMDLPKIKGIDEKLMAIISKACSFKDSDRYLDATEMKIELEELSKLNIYSQNSVDYIENDNDDTIGIYEINEMSNDGNINLVSKVKNVFFDKRRVKKLIIASVFVMFVLFLGVRFLLVRDCEDGYVNKNGMCVKGYYYCKSGYELNDDNKCQKTLESINAKLTYTCKKGYTLNGDVCVSQDVRQPQQIYKCVDGFTLNGKKCEREESADAVRTYVCPKDYVSAGDKCVTATNVAATKSGYTCDDSSYVLSGNICKKTTTKTIRASVSYGCDTGGILNGTVCTYSTNPSWYSWMPNCAQGTYNRLTKKCEYTKDANIVYKCSDGTSDGNGNCIISSITTKDAIVKYSCPSGYTSVGNQCAKVTDISASIKYICADGANLRGTKCYTTISTDAVSMLDCGEGYVASATGCYKDDFPSAVKKYTCSRVYTLNGDKCEKYEIVSSKVHYGD